MMRFASARIVTTDVAALACFYGKLTGAAAVGSDEYVELRMAGATLAISSATAMTLFGGGAATPCVILDFEVDDVDAERVRMDGIVAEWVLMPTTQPWGNRSMLFRDADGNLINVFTRARARER
jgi:catechol 2,3-dioxygenase-like lactoylglutathione lyase family enzyme